MIKAVSHHIEQQFGTWTRYKRHTSSGDQAGIAVLQKAYLVGDIFAHTQGREISIDADRAPDFVKHGMDRLNDTMERWAKARSYPRSTRQDWAHYEQNSMENMDIEV